MPGQRSWGNSIFHLCLKCLCGIISMNLMLHLLPSQSPGNILVVLVFRERPFCTFFWKTWWLSYAGELQKHVLPNHKTPTCKWTIISLWKLLSYLQSVCHLDLSFSAFRWVLLRLPKRRMREEGSSSDPWPGEGKKNAPIDRNVVITIPEPARFFEMKIITLLFIHRRVYTCTYFGSFYEGFHVWT